MSTISFVNGNLPVNKVFHTENKIKHNSNGNEHVSNVQQDSKSQLTQFKSGAYAYIAAIATGLSALLPSVAGAADPKTPPRLIVSSPYGPQYQDTYNADGTINFDAMENNIREAYRKDSSGLEKFYRDMEELKRLREKSKGKSMSFYEAMRIPPPKTNVYYPKVTSSEMKRVIVGLLNSQEEKSTLYGIEGYISQIKSKMTGYNSTAAQYKIGTQYDAFIRTVSELKELARQATDEQWNAYYKHRSSGGAKSTAYAEEYYAIVSKYNKTAKELVEKNMGIEISGDFYNVPAKYKNQTQTQLKAYLP